MKKISYLVLTVAAAFNSISAAPAISLNSKLGLIHSPRHTPSTTIPGPLSNIDVASLDSIEAKQS